MPGGRVLALTVALSLAGCALEAEHDAPRVAAQALGAPENSTTGATSVTNASATLSGSANPSGLATTGWFRYDTANPGTCNDTFGTRVPASGGTDLGSGSAVVAYSQSISGLAAGTTYYFCAIATNSDGWGFGQLLSFTTLAPPTVTTSAAFAVTATGATLSGSANPRGDSGYGYFRYATSNPGVCDDTFGTRVPAASAADRALGAGSSAVSYSFAISGLTPATTYYYCAIARNAYGTSFGGVLSFTTPAAMPTVTTSSPTLVTGGTAQLNGAANPGGATTTGWFRYSTVSPGFCNDTFGTRAPATGGASLGSGTAATAFSQGISGLSPGTTFYVCAIASSSVGTSFGSVVSFTTPSAPAAATWAATSVTNASATLNGAANPNRAAAIGWFRYSTTNPGTCSDAFGTRAPASGGASLGSGSAAVAYSQSITGLSAGTTYYYCAAAYNSEGTGYGAVLSFTTLAPPAVTTLAASAVTATGATLNGSANPGGTAAYGYFRYSASDPGTCNDTFGTRAPASSSSDTFLGAGSTAVSYSLAISGLTPATTYYSCAIARNAYGTSFGAVLSFTTAAAVPTVTTTSPTLVTGSAAQLNGTANPGGAATTGWFRYSTASPGTCNDTFGTRAPATGGSSLGAGTTATSFSQAVSGLGQATTYYVCAIVSSSVGTSFGSLVSFTTPSAPTASTSLATSVTDSSATLNGSANPNRASTAGWFRYSTSSPGACNDTFGARAPASGGTALGSGSGSVAYSQSISGLSAGTTYYYCAIATSAEGTAFGAVLVFTTLAAPTVTTSAATAVTTSAATLNGFANPRGDATTGWFRYATTSPGTCNDTFGTRAPASGGTSLGSGFGNNWYSVNVSGLSPATTYHFCAIARNAYGTSFGAVLSFTTPAAMPAVTTTSPTLVTGGAAQLNGTANPGGAATTGWFRYSTTSPGTCNDFFGTRAPATGGSSLGAGTAATSFSQAVSGLSQGTTYFVCAIASSSVGTALGSVVSFTTPSAPTVATAAATSLTDATATLNGSVNPNRASTTGWFRYDTIDPGACSDSFGTRAPATGAVDLGSGSISTPYSQSIGGLSAGRTYYCCAIATSSEGTAFGAVLSFTTPAAAPSVATGSAAVLTGSAAMLNGSAHPGGDATTGWFRYSTTSPGTCNDTFGTRAPASGGTSLGAGTTPASFSQGITGLTRGTTYYFCAVAANSIGTSFGDVVAFTTADAPTVTSEAATEVTSTGAVLSGTATPHLAATTGWFRYAAADPGACDDTFGTRVPVSDGTALGAGSTPVSYAAAVTGLAPGATYYFCAIAANSEATSFGEVLSFTALAAPPIVTTSPPTGVLGGSAVLHASAVPRGDATTGWFRYDTTDPGACDDTFGARAPASGGVTLGSGVDPVAYSETLSTLTTGTVYYYCAIASSSLGMSFGEVVSFSPGVIAPTVTTRAASVIGGTGATIAGSANPNGSQTAGWFRYGTAHPGECDDSFGTRAPGTGAAALGGGASAIDWSEELTGLEPNLTYHYCAAASNAGGAEFGEVHSFTTDPLPPVVRTVSASVGDAGVVTLRGAADPRGSLTTGWFRYDVVRPGACDDAFGIRAPSADGTSLEAGRAEVAFSQPVAGLAPGTYYACAIASNAAGAAHGEVLAFTVPAPEEEAPGGCGCRTGTQGSGATMTVVAVLLLALRRVRRPAPARTSSASRA